MGGLSKISFVLTRLRNELDDANSLTTLLNDRRCCAIKRFARQQQTKVRERNVRFDLGFIPAFDVNDLTQILELVVGRYCPKIIGRILGRFFQVMENHSDFSGTASLMWLDKDIRSRAFHRAAEVDLNLGIVAFLEVRN